MIVPPNKPLYARLSKKDGRRILCGVPTCDVRFGEVLHGRYVGIDSGWTVVQRDGLQRLELNSRQRRGYQEAKRRRMVSRWRAAAPKKDQALPYKLADLHGTPWIVCPEHGPQLVDHRALGTTEWFDAEEDLGGLAWVPWPATEGEH